MIAVGGIGTLVCLVLFTLQAGRNGKNKEKDRCGYSGRKAE